MTRIGYGWRKGGIRVEYLIAAGISAALVVGLTLVLLDRYTRRAELPSAKPTAGLAPARPTPTPQPRPVQPTPQPKPRPQATAQPEKPQPQKPKTQSPQVPAVTAKPRPKPAPQGEDTHPSKTYVNSGPSIISTSGKTRIEAADFDAGGEGVAYHDTTPENEGHAYRQDEGVDIASIKDPEGTYAVGWIVDGEWINYTIRVVNPGLYRIHLRASRGAAGQSKLRLLFDGSDKIGDIAIPSTGDFFKFKTFDAGQVDLSAGDQVMRVDVVSGDFGLEWIELVPGSEADAQTAPGEATRAQTPDNGGVVTAEDGSTVIAADTFEDAKVGFKPAGDLWTWSTSGLITVQQSPQSADKCVRIVDASRTTDAWIRRSFPAQKDKIIWTGRVRFGSLTDGCGVSLVEKDKVAVRIFTQGGQLGVENGEGKWQALKKIDANAWYTIRIEASVKDKKFTVLIDNDRVGETGMKFRNQASEINGWTAGTSAPAVGTMFISSITVSVP